MKLSDRNAKIVNLAGGTRTGMGVSWECLACGERHWVPFENPIDGKSCVSGVAWKRIGETLETLTLTPSILFHPSPGCAGRHGYITNGELATCP